MEATVTGFDLEFLNGIWDRVTCEEAGVDHGTLTIPQCSLSAMNSTAEGSFVHRLLDVTVVLRPVTHFDVTHEESRILPLSLVVIECSQSIGYSIVHHSIPPSPLFTEIQNTRTTHARFHRRKKLVRILQRKELVLLRDTCHNGHSIQITDNLNRYGRAMSSDIVASVRKDVAAPGGQRTDCGRNPFQSIQKHII